MSGRERSAVRLGEALKAYLSRSRLKSRLDQASVIPDWETLVGPRIAQVATPQTVTENGILIVTVSSAAWMQELQLMTPEIMRQLGRRGKKIRRIVWRAE